MGHTVSEMIHLEYWTMTCIVSISVEVSVTCLG